MRPHSGKPKTGFKEGRNKTKGSSKLKDKENGITKPGKGKNVSIVDDAQEAVDDFLDVSLLDEDGHKKADRFAREFRKLRKQVGADNDHFNIDQSSTRMLRALLVMTLDAIPIAEAVFRSSKKESSVYALNALMNQARELTTELRMSRDYEGQALFIRESILTPIFKSFIQQMLNEHQHLKNTIDTQVGGKDGRKIKESVDNVTRSLGKFLQESITKTYSDIDNYLQGNMQSLMPKKSSKRSQRG